MTYTCAICGGAFDYMDDGRITNYLPACCDSCIAEARRRVQAEAHESNGYDEDNEGGPRDETR